MSWHCSRLFLLYKKVTIIRCDVYLFSFFLAHKINDVINKTNAIISLCFIHKQINKVSPNLKVICIIIIISPFVIILPYNYLQDNKNRCSWYCDFLSNIFSYTICECNVIILDHSKVMMFYMENSKSTKQCICWTIHLNILPLGWQDKFTKSWNEGYK